MMLKILLLIHAILIFPGALFSESRITIKNDSYLSYDINMPDLTRFNGESTDYPVRISACDKYGIKKSLNNKSLGYLHPGDTVMIEIANDFVKEHVEKNTIIFSPILRNYTGRCLLNIFAVRYNSPLARRKLLRGELLDGLNFKIFLRAWYVIKPEGIACEYFYDAIK